MQESFPISKAAGTTDFSRRPVPTQANSRSATAAASRTALVWCSAAHPAGGMERIAISIANGLAHRGWKVVLIGPFRAAPVLHAAISPQVEFINYRPGRSALGLYRTMQFIEHTSRERGVDVISAHGSLFPLLRTATPVVWTEHDIRYGGSMLRGLRGLAWRWIRLRILQKSWRVVTVSRYVQSQLRRNLNMAEDPGHVIYNGLPNADVLKALPPPRMIAPFQIGFLGRLAPIKYPLDVFDLSSKLNQMGVSHEWNVFGDGELMPEMRALAAQPSGHSVRMRGLANKPEEAFARMDLLCFLSRGEQEGLGMVLLEAMAANRHVVAWDSGCIGEVLAGRGTLVPPPFSLQRFAEAIAAALQDGASRLPPEHDSRWDEARMIDDYDNVLKEATQQSRTAETVGS